MRCAPRHCASRRTKKVRRPRSMRKAACGSSVRPSTVRSDRMAWISSARPIIAPPITSPCPETYLVRLCT